MRYALCHMEVRIFDDIGIEMTLVIYNDQGVPVYVSLYINR